MADGREFVVAGGDSATTQVLFVFSKECHFCAQTLPAWLAIDSALAGDRLQVHVVGISLDSAGAAAAYASENHLGFPIVQFPDLRMRAVYRAREVPLTMVVDAQGRVLYAETGLLHDRLVIDSIVASARGRRAVVRRPTVAAGSTTEEKEGT